MHFFRMIMKIYIGLGNPGEKYTNNRHNIGSRVLDEIAIIEKSGSWYEKFQSEIFEFKKVPEKILLIKPQTFMNNSGYAINAIKQFYKLNNAKITVFHDDLDLAPGKIRIKYVGGHGGHNGLRSIHQFIGNDYVRVRIGIGHPGNKENVSNYVLSNFSMADKLWTEPLVKNIRSGMCYLIDDHYDKFLNHIILE